MNEVEALSRGVILSAWTQEASGFAGALLFARDGESVAEARERTDALRSNYGPLPPLLAIDQEGGRVARLRAGVEILPPMMSLGATGDESLALRAGEATAHDLRRAGVTVDFAPVLDLAVEPANTVIGTRSFGSDPLLVSKLGGAFARGLRNGGITPTLKHFPGHGSTWADSHLELPKVTLDRVALNARDLAPFAACLREDVAVMTAHVIYDAFDPQVPASLSRLVIDGALRKELGFDGVVFTDCLQMSAVASAGPIEAAVAAIGAGADCAIVSHDINLATACALRLAMAVETGEMPLERLREAHDRVVQLRRRAVTPLPLDLPSPHPGIGREIARRAVTLVRGSARAEAATSLAISFEGTSFEGAGGTQAGASLQAYAPRLEVVRASFEPDPGEVKYVCGALSRSGRRAIVLARRAHLYPDQAAAIDAVLDIDPDAIVVSAREPFDIPLLRRARNVLAIYGDDSASLGGLADVLFGGEEPSGKMPVRL